jgi:hypothetical protein
VSVAQDIPLELTTLQEEHYSGDDFDIKGAQMSDIEFILRLDTHSDKIIQTITVFNKTVKLAKSFLKSKALEEQKVLVIDQARQVVNEIGQFLSLVEEVKVLDVKNVEKLVTSFNQRKEVLYTSVNDLITIARLTVDPYGNSSSFDRLLEMTNVCEKCVEDLSSSVKLIVDQEQSLELHLLAQEADNFGVKDSVRRSLSQKIESSELGQLQRRAMSLTFSKSDVLEGIKSGNLSMEDLYGDNAKNLVKEDSSTTIKTSSSMHGKKNDSDLIPRHDSMRYKESSSTIDAPTFLRYDYRSDEISFNMDGQVNGGTVEALVERLTLHDQPVGTS